LYEKCGIKRQILVARTAQKNAVVERNNILMQEMERKMLLEEK